MDLLMAILLLVYVSCSFSLGLYGITIAFKKKWYLGLAAIIIPGFALTLGVFKFFFKRDLLA